MTKKYRLLKAYRGIFFDGAVKVPGLNRIDGNKKGVFTRNRQPKMAAWLLRERWTGRSAQRRIMDA